MVIFKFLFIVNRISKKSFVLYFEVEKKKNLQINGILLSQVKIKRKMQKQ